jgi:hypothetical protein
MILTKAESTALNLALKDLALRTGEDRIGAILKTSGALLGDGGVCTLLDKLDSNCLSRNEQRALLKQNLHIKQEKKL